MLRGGVVQYAWATGDTDTIGKYKGEFEVTFVGNLKQTFPNDDYLLIEIKADLDE